MSQPLIQGSPCCSDVLCLQFSLIAIIWSMNASTCLRLAGINLLVWCRNRAAWAHSMNGVNRRYFTKEPSGLNQSPLPTGQNEKRCEPLGERKRFERNSTVGRARVSWFFCACCRSGCLRRLAAAVLRASPLERTRFHSERAADWFDEQRSKYAAWDLAFHSLPLSVAASWLSIRSQRQRVPRRFSVLGRWKKQPALQPQPRQGSINETI